MKKLLKPRTDYMIIFLILTTMFIFQTATAADYTKLNAGGERILDIVQRLGYWIIVVKCVTELIRQALQGELHTMGKTIMMYVMLYGALFFVPWMLRLVEGIF